MGDARQQGLGFSSVLAAVVMAGLGTACSLVLANTSPFKFDAANESAAASKESAKAGDVAKAAGGGTANSQAIDSWGAKAPATIMAPDAIVPVKAVPESTTLGSLKGGQQASYSAPVAGDKTPALSGAVASSGSAASSSGPTVPGDAQKEHLPAGPGQPTPVTIKSGGGSAAPVQRVEFFISKPFKTPTREPSAAKVEGIPVTFGQSNYEPKADKFAVGITTPQVAPVPNQPIPLAVAIVWPSYAGWSYRGKLQVHQAGQQPLTIENVEVDIVRELPK